MPIHMTKRSVRELAVDDATFMNLFANRALNAGSNPVMIGPAFQPMRVQNDQSAVWGSAPI
jgi:hypothetical protein